MTPLAETLQALRIERGWSQAVMADKVGVHRSQLNRIEKGSREPSLDTLRRIARRMGLTEAEMDRLGRSVIASPVGRITRVNGATVIRLRQNA